jgi:hypothetical protein
MKIICTMGMSFRSSDALVHIWSQIVYLFYLCIFVTWVTKNVHKWSSECTISSDPSNTKWMPSIEVIIHVEVTLKRKPWTTT